MALSLFRYGTFVISLFHYVTFVISLWCLRYFVMASSLCRREITIRRNGTNQPTYVKIQIVLYIFLSIIALYTMYLPLSKFCSRSLRFLSQSTSISRSVSLRSVRGVVIIFFTASMFNPAIAPVRRQHYALLPCNFSTTTSTSIETTI